MQQHPFHLETHVIESLKHTFSVRLHPPIFSKFSNLDVGDKPSQFARTLNIFQNNIYHLAKAKSDWLTCSTSNRQNNVFWLHHVCLSLRLSLSLFLFLSLFNSCTELPSSTFFASNGDSEYDGIFLVPHRLRSRHLRPIRFQQPEPESCLMMQRRTNRLQDVRVSLITTTTSIWEE